MAKNLVIVESPSKAKTINKYLGKDFKVEACNGHIRDLPPKKLGIEIEKDFEPEYQVLESRKKMVSQLRKSAKEAEAVYLAPDPDREGEAIAWHLAEALRIPKKKTFRVTFNEITKKAVQAAFSDPGKIDDRKVNAQQARRILDRIVGYKLSPLLWKKVAKGLSAGRVQSVAVRLIVEREKEITAFNPEEYWKITADLATQPDGKEDTSSFIAELRKLDGEDVGLGKKVPVSSEEDAMAIVAELETAKYVITDIKQKRQKNHPNPPFITSTLQQAGSTRYGYSAQRTMRIAQDLYEGVDVGGGEGAVGLITYMRTDSVRISDEALASARELIEKDFGKKYLSEKPNVYKSRQGAQAAHEAIRPTDVTLRPQDIKAHLTVDQLKLYKLIWERFVSSQMAPAEFDVTEVSIEAGRGLFIARGRVLLFDGHLKVSSPPAPKNTAKKEEDVEPEENGKEKDQILPPLSVDQVLDLLSLNPTQHFTKPPPRYSEASLVKILEREGIGRPSTYAAIITNIQQRGYVEKEGRQFHATELGIIVTDKLVKHFPDILDYKFTSGMEENLDKIEEGFDWVSLTSEFYQLFKKDLDKASKEMTRVSDDLNKTFDPGLTCEKCGEKILIRMSKQGKFLGCSGFPKCRNTMQLESDGKTVKPQEPPEETDEICEECEKAMIVRVARKGRSKGSRFLACSGYPDCKFIKSYSMGLPCVLDGCDGELVEKASRGRIFYGCSKYPDCKNIVKKLPGEANAEAEIEAEADTGQASVAADTAAVEGQS